MIDILPTRKEQITTAGSGDAIACSKPSVAGSVSQRACVFCGSRVVLYPIADALHLVHGPVGCAAYTWDIRGALSSGPQLHRNSFTTDIREKDVIYGGADKLYAALTELIVHYHPKAAFVYSTCIVGLIGDDVQGICNKVAREQGIPVIPVDSPGFAGTKKDGYRAACEALLTLIAWPGAKTPAPDAPPYSINILGDFNIAGEVWIIKEYFRRIGIHVVSCITGDGRVDEIRRAPTASLNLVQCSGSMTHLAKALEEKHGTPFMRVSYFGLEDMAESLYKAAQFFQDDALMAQARILVREEISKILPDLQRLRRDLQGKRAAIYVGGAFKAFSLVKALRHLGMTTALVGSQTGNPDDYRTLQQLCDPGTVIVDDTNPLELAKFLLERDVDLFIGGVKERPIAYKLGIAFCDHNHERKIPLAGFEGMLHFAREVHGSVMSPVWQFTPRRAGRKAAGNGGAA
jgi:nitrogenase molybdenum-cofactor synthesis protein NifE